MDQPIAKKLVNALISDVEMNSVAKKLIELTSHGLTTAVIEAMKKKMGGYWVGGTLALYADRLEFRPNFANEWLHDGDCGAALALVDVIDIRVRQGLVTNIIDIVAENRTLSVRCYGAAGFADRIRAHWLQVRRTA